MIGLRLTKQSNDAVFPHTFQYLELQTLHLIIFWYLELFVLSPDQEVICSVIASPPKHW